MSRTLEAPTLEGLKKQIEKEYFNLENPIGADVQLFDGAIEIQFQGEYLDIIPKEDQIPFIVTARIVISKVEETYLDLSAEALFKNIYKE